MPGRRTSTHTTRIPHGQRAVFVCLRMAGRAGIESGKGEFRVRHCRSGKLGVCQGVIWFCDGVFAFQQLLFGQGQCCCQFFPLFTLTPYCLLKKGFLHGKEREKKGGGTE